MTAERKRRNISRFELYDCLASDKECLMPGKWERGGGDLESGKGAGEMSRPQANVPWGRQKLW